MTELILFGLKRRFLNKTFLISQLLLITLLASLMNADRIALYFGFTPPGHLPLSLMEQASEVDEALANAYGFTLQEEAVLSVVESIDGYEVRNSAQLDGIHRLQLQAYLTTLSKNEFLAIRNPSVAELIQEYESVEIRFDTPMEIRAVGKESFVFMILTAVYFMVLNFAAMTSNEVVGEKSANVLDMVLSATDAKSHYRAKLFGGWLTMILQGCFALGTLSVFAMLRNQSDLGRGLLSWASQFGLVDREVTSFRALFEMLDLDFSFGMTIALCVFFLLCGMAILQILMTVIATKLKSAEEASILQGPVYIFLLILYYVALSQNTIPRLSQGFGKIASYVPISSMLFMPMRLLSLKLGAGEILLSGFVAVTSLLALLFAGQRIYEKGLRHEKVFKICIVKNRAK